MGLDCKYFGSRSLGKSKFFSVYGLWGFEKRYGRGVGDPGILNKIVPPACQGDHILGVFSFHLGGVGLG